MRILANDGIAADGKAALEAAGFEVITETIPQDKLASEINNFDALVVRSATKVNAQILDAAERLKLVVRAGVGIDNIDTNAAEKNGIAVRNTPTSSSLSVAELVIAHMFSLARFLHESNRQMPAVGATQFKELKKQYEKGIELRGKTLGIIGFGRIGAEVGKIAIGLGMEVIIYNNIPVNLELSFDHLPFKPTPKHTVEETTLEDLCKRSDFISIHVPYTPGEPPLLSKDDFATMKKGVCIINCSRGGVINEAEMAEALEAGTLGFVGLDVFENEPNISEAVLKMKNASYSPHIGASTKEAQLRVSKEVASTVIEFFHNGNK
ncbi:MAG: D-2-hydroxyacid dehydrogenase [Bacteroidia bacterium]